MNATKIAQACNDAQVYRLQEKLLTRCYGAPRNSALRQRVAARYNETVQVMVDRHTKDASCNLIDPDLYSMFSDCFKEECGCRPGAWSYEMVTEYMAPKWIK